MAEKKVKLISDLPIIPEVAMKVMDIATDNLDISFKELENIIKVDPGLTSKILKVANSALYSRQKEITNLQTAITLLGFKNIKSLVLLLTASSIFQKARQTNFYKTFWRHSIITAFIAKILAKNNGKNDIAENVFICALLHKIGKVLLFTSDQAAYTKIMEDETTKDTWIESLEEEVFETNYRKLGGELFKSWNFPNMFIDVAEEHNSQNITSPHKNIIIIVTIASLLTDKFGFGSFTTPKKELLDKMLPHLSLKPEDVEYYEKNYSDLLAKDKLFEECQNLVGLNT